MKKNVFFLMMVFFLASCGGQGGQEQRVEEQASLSETEQAFLDNLASLCGKSFQGTETYVEPGRESWSHMTKIMHVTVCEDDKVHIPFHVDEDQSRTWMFINEDGRLRFRHDHRYPDGTPEEKTLYGGYADGKGTAFAQYFPADDYTIELLTDTLNRKWNVVMSEEMDVFSYQLEYHGEVIFRVDFDLTTPIEK